MILTFLDFILIFILILIIKLRYLTVLILNLYLLIFNYHLQHASVPNPKLELASNAGKSHADCLRFLSSPQSSFRLRCINQRNGVAVNWASRSSTSLWRTACQLPAARAPCPPIRVNASVSCRLVHRPTLHSRQTWKNRINNYRYW